MIHWILELFGVRRRDWRCRDRAYRAGRNSGRRWWHPGTRKRVIRGPTLSSGGWRVASALPVRANTCTAPRRTVATPKIFDLELIAGDHNAILLFPWPSLLWTLNFELLTVGATSCATWKNLTGKRKRNWVKCKRLSSHWCRSSSSGVPKAEG